MARSPATARRSPWSRTRPAWTRWAPAWARAARACAWSCPSCAARRSTSSPSTRSRPASSRRRCRRARTRGAGGRRGQAGHGDRPDDQLSLAIGKDGLNARLAARLTGWRVDIRSETEFAEEEAEMGYQEEEVSGRCAAILANGKRCPNASLPGSRYCGLPAHQALADQPTDYVVPPEEGGNGAGGEPADEGEVPSRWPRKASGRWSRRSRPTWRRPRTSRPRRPRQRSKPRRPRDRSTEAAEGAIEPEAAEGAIEADVEIGETPPRPNRATRPRPRRSRRATPSLRRLRTLAAQGELLRLVRGEDGGVRLDPSTSTHGRGAYVCARRSVRR